MSADLLLVALMGGALAFTAWMWVPPRRGSGLEPSTQAASAQLDEPPRRIEPFVQASPNFADLVTIGGLEQRPSMPRLPRRLRAMRALGAKPGELVQAGALRRSVVAEVTPEQKRAIVLAAALEVADDTDPPDDDPTPERESVLDDDSGGELPPMGRGSRDREADLRAARYGLVRLDGGVRWAGVEPERTDTWPPAAVEEE